MSRRFEDYLDNQYDVIAQMAALLVEAQEGYNAGEMTRSEFNEIAKNILEFAEIDKMTSDVDQKQFIKETIDTLIFIVDHIPMA